MARSDCSGLNAGPLEPQSGITESAKSPLHGVKVGCVAIVGAEIAPTKGNAQVNFGPTELRMFLVDGTMRNFGPPQNLGRRRLAMGKL